jgi:hypothetical protein
MKLLFFIDEINILFSAVLTIRESLRTSAIYIYLEFSLVPMPANGKGVFQHLIKDLLPTGVDINLKALVALRAIKF